MPSKAYDQDFRHKKKMLSHGGVAIFLASIATV